MYIASPCSLNPITGRKVWLVREIPTGEYGDKWLSSFVAIRRFWLSRTVGLHLAENVGTVKRYRAMQEVLRSLGFKEAYATRHGRIKCYKLG